jgi:spore germination protein
MPMIEKFLNSTSERTWSFVTSFLAIICIALIFANNPNPIEKIINPLLAGDSLAPLEKSDHKYEVFGFVPFWTMHRVDNVDFETLSTLAYFGVPVLPSGDLDTEDIGYTRFHSDKATELFTKAHQNGTRVVLTVTQMKNPNIEAILESDEAQQRAVDQTVAEVKKRGIDGVNIDFEYVGNPGKTYRDEFSQFVRNMTETMHREVPGSRVTVSVYASAARSPKLYDIASIGKDSDGIFMMAYDFAVAGSEKAAPTAPLYGYKEGKYGYDIATAVEDFKKVMPANKIILGVPYYGYNYPVATPKENANTYPSWTWYGYRATQTYQLAQDNINPQSKNTYKEGWDDVAKVGWKAYKSEDSNTWRMIFLDDSKSLGIKYDFAKEQGLQGVGMWALGFDDGKTELWALLREKFGTKLADSRVANRKINESL